MIGLVSIGVRFRLIVLITSNLDAENYGNGVVARSVVLFLGNDIIAFL